MKSGLRAPTLEELGIINTNFAKKELKADDIYVFDLMAANSKSVTSLFSKLGNDMIEAFHANAEARKSSPEAPIIGFLFGHNKEMIPSGTIFQSKLEEEAATEGAPKTLTFKPSVYMAKNLNVGGINTDEYVRAYEAGHTEDVSVGFIAGSYICDICNNDVRSWNCSHVPGRVYNLSQDPEKPIMRQATYTVHQGAHKRINLAEVSGVYKGALPGARVENQLSVPKEGKPGEKAEELTVLMSRNIKDFREGDVLRFNCAGDGVIELLERAEPATAEEMKAAVAERDKKILVISGELKDVKAEKEALATINTALTAKQAELGKAVQDVTSKLAASEAEKIAISTKLAASEDALKKSLAETQELMKDLRERSERFSIRINGMNHKADLFAKEIAGLGPKELSAKCKAQEDQLAQMFPSGRRSEESRTVHGMVERQGSYVNPDLYKME